MNADDRLREIAESNGWPSELLEQMRTLLAVECNVAFDHGQRVERGAWERRGLETDAARYRWLKKELAEDDTRYAEAKSLDAVIDAAMAGAQP